MAESTLTCLKGPISFTKMESIGNDFVLVHMDDVAEEELPQLARNVCRRHFSVGSDGLLALGVENGTLTLRMFNPDGSEDFCGNGLRCAAIYAFSEGWAGKDALIRHHGRVVHTQLIEDGFVRTWFDAASFEPAAVPFETLAISSYVDAKREDHGPSAPSSSKELFLAPLRLDHRTVEISAVSTGSTHTIIFTEELPSDEEFERVGPAIECHPLFPERTSVIWVKEVGPGDLSIRIWERGAGETRGCGTGSAAAAVVYARASDFSGLITVRNPGGVVRVALPDWRGPYTTEAPAHIVFKGTARLGCKDGESAAASREPCASGAVHSCSHR